MIELLEPDLVDASSTVNDDDLVIVLFTWHTVPYKTDLMPRWNAKRMAYCFSTKCTKHELAYLHPNGVCMIPYAEMLNFRIEAVTE